VLVTCILAQKHNLRVRNAISHDFPIKLTPGNGR